MKKVQSFISKPRVFVGLLVLLGGSQVSYADPDAIVELPLNEGSGFVAGDVSGMGNDGTLLNGAQFEASTGDGSAFSVRFDGSNDYIDLGNLDVNHTGLTLACWFNADSFPGSSKDPRLISKASGTAGNAHVFMLSTIKSGSAVRLRARVRVGGTTKTLIAGSGDLVTGHWKHAAMTYDGSRVRLYLNAVEVGSTPFSGAVDTDGSIPVAVGSQPPGAGPRFFDGLLDDVRILQRALTVAELAAIVGSNEDTVAVDDGVYTTNEDTVLNVNAASGVLANDSDPYLDPLQAILVGDVSNGSLNLNTDGSFDYTPNPNYNGPDSFSYQAFDGLANSNLATVSLMVTSVEDIPVAVNNSFSTPEDTALVVTAASGVLANDTDGDQDPLQALLVSDVANGTLNLNLDGSFDYTPDGGFSGQDSFTYVANDGDDDSNTATVTIDVGASDPDALVILPLDEGSGTVASDFSGMGNDGTLVNGPVYDSNTGDGSSFSVRFDGSNDSIDLGTLDVNGSGLTLACWINADSFPGSSKDPRLISKASGLSANDHVFMLSTIKSGGAVRLRGRVRIGGTTTTFIAPSGDLVEGQWQHAALTYDGFKLRLYLNGAEMGNTTLSGSIDQAPGLSVAVGSQPAGAGPRYFDGLIDDVRILQRALTPAELVSLATGNGSPVANGDSYNATEDNALVVNAANGVLSNDTDPEMDPLQAFLVGNASNGLVNLNPDGSFTYTPNLNFNGSDSFSYRANGGSTNSNTATVAIAVAGVNDPPVAVDDNYQTTPSTGLNVNAATGVLSNDSDVDLDTLQAFLVGDVSNGTLNLNSDGSFDYTPNPGFGGTDTFTYRANDGSENSNLATVSIVVEVPPTAEDDDYGVDEDQSLVVPAATGVLANDTDNNPLSDLTAVQLTSPTNGTLSAFGSDGSFTYVPNANFNGTDSFTYEAVDEGNGARTEATVDITIAAVNDAPTAGNDSYETDIDTALVVNAATGVLADDSDVDMDPLQAILVTDVSSGTLNLSSDGSFTYTPNGGFTGQDTFTYRANDSTLNSNLATVTINVDPISGPDIDVWFNNAQDFGALGRPNEWYNILGNVSDPAGVTSLTYSLNGGPQATLSIGHDTTRLVGIGDFNVEIDVDDLQSGANSVLLRATNGQSEQSTKTVSVNYIPGNVWPIPYNIDWSTVTDLQSVAQVVDGYWEIDSAGVRSTQAGYDRLIDIGDLTWTDYQITAEVTVNDVPTLPLPDAGNEPGIGFIIRWEGHNENPPNTPSSQPRVGFTPLGSIHWYRYGSSPRFEITNSSAQAVASNSSFNIQEGTTYKFRSHVQTLASGHKYTFTVWEKGLPSDSGFTISSTRPLSEPANGSVLLVSHKLDATFGEINISLGPVAPPSITPAGGVFASPVSVSLAPGGLNPGDLYYTLDGSEPIQSSIPYTGPFTLSSDTTVKTRFYQSGVTPSDIVSADFIILSPSGSRVENDLEVMYAFDENGGNTIFDVAGSGTPVDLTIPDLGAVTWSSEALTIDSATLITSGGPATGLSNSIISSDAITIEAWAAPANTTQNGPARIVTLSADSHNRNFTLGQGASLTDGDRYDVRLRTTTTGNNGTSPSTTSPGGTLVAGPGLTHVVHTRDAAGSAKIYVNNAEVVSSTIGGTMSNWNTGYQLGLANEMNNSRPWLGTFYLVAVYSRALSQAEVSQNFTAGPDASPPTPPSSSQVAAVSAEAHRSAGQPSVIIDDRNDRLKGSSELGNQALGSNSFRITNIERKTPKTLAIDWNAMPGSVYQIESSSLEAGDDWQPIGDQIKPTATTQSAILELGDIPPKAQFFRIRELSAETHRK